MAPKLYPIILALSSPPTIVDPDIGLYTVNEPWYTHGVLQSMGEIPTPFGNQLENM